MADQPLKVSEDRRGLVETGIYVRAQTNEGKWESADIRTLEPESLLRWLRSRGGENAWAERVVFLLLGYRNEDFPES